MSATKKTLYSRIALAVLGMWVVVAVLGWNLADVRKPTKRIFPKELAPHSVEKNSVEKAKETQPSHESTLDEQNLDEQTLDPASIQQTSLLEAVTQGNYRRILELLRESDQPQTLGNDGELLLHTAVHTNDSLIARLLLAYGVDPGQPNADGLIPMQLYRARKTNAYISEADQREMLDVFIHHYALADDERTRERAQARFFVAALAGDFAQARTALNSGALATATHSSTGLTPLHLNENPELVSDIIALGVALDAVTVTGESALSLAAGAANADLTRALLGHGAQIQVEDNTSDLLRALKSRTRDSGSTALALLNASASLRGIEWRQALRLQNEHGLRALMKHSGGFDPDTKEGKGLIKLARSSRNQDVLKVLRTNSAIKARLDGIEREEARNGTQWKVKLVFFLLPYFLILLVLSYLFTLVSAGFVGLFVTAPRLFRWSVALSTVAMVELFVFTATVRLQLDKFRLFGEEVPNFKWVLFVFIGGIVLSASLAAQSRLRFLADWLVGAVYALPRLVVAPATVALYVLVVVGLVQHNNGSLTWPSQVVKNLLQSDEEAAAEIAATAATARHQAAWKQRRLDEVQKRAQAGMEERARPAFNLDRMIYQRSSSGVREELEKGYAVETLDIRGKTLIEKAMRSPNKAVVEVLLEAGAEVDQVTADGARPIHKLLRRDADSTALPVLEQLIAVGADVTTPDAQGMTPLCLAVQLKSLGLSQRAINMLSAAQEGVPEQTQLGDSCPIGVLIKHPAALGFLVQNGFTFDIDLDVREPYQRLREDNGVIYAAPALWQAAYEDDSVRVAKLLELGANVEARDTRWGMTPLQLVIHRFPTRGGTETLKILLAHGARVDQRTWDGRTTDELARRDRFTELLATAE